MCKFDTNMHVPASVVDMTNVVRTVVFVVGARVTELVETTVLLFFLTNVHTWAKPNR